MAAYLIADIEVTDPAGFEEYRQLVGPLVDKFGGRYIVRGGPSETVEGDWSPGTDCDYRIREYGEVEGMVRI